MLAPSSSLALRSLAKRQARSLSAAAATAAVETKQMNLFTAINDAMRVALATDPTAVVFGEDVAVRRRVPLLGWAQGRVRGGPCVQLAAL
ncbi:hypothetical protein PINS_up022013 [Pythium insidiosum]|nr:hypothetical protein PINS_up022013 [Pythium insidiosum]